MLLIDHLLRNQDHKQALAAAQSGVAAVPSSAELLGALDQVSLLGGLAALPIALWELSLGLWLTVRAVPHVAVPTEPGEVVRLREMTTDVGPVPAE